MSPIYEFRCKTDGTYFEIRKDFSDDSVPDCALCGKPMGKVFSPTPTHFKTGGFYKTDNK